MTGPGRGADPRTHAADIIAAARAVADPARPVLLLIDRDGRKSRAGWENLENLARLAETNPERLSRLSFAVAVADDILAIDCDTTEAAAAAEEIAQWCRMSGAEPVLVSSGRPGHVHLWCVTNNPPLHRACVRHAARAGADVRTGRYMRPPGAAHTTPAEVTIDIGIRGAIDALTVARLEGAEITAADTDESRTAGAAERRGGADVVQLPGATAAQPGSTGNSGTRHHATRPATNELAQHAAGRLAASTLTARTLELLRRGDDRGDRSAVLQSICVGMLNRGWTIEAAWDALMVPKHVGGAKLQERARRHGLDAAWAYLTHSWDNATAWVAANPPQGCSDTDAAAIDELATEADTHPWGGEAGASAWMVLHVLCLTGRRGPGCVLGASERDLAERAGLSRPAVHAALERLMDRGWITRLQVGRGPLASVWRLETGDEARARRDASRSSVPLPHPPTRNTSVGGVVENGMSMRVGSDAFRRGALGANGYRVLRHLYLYGAAKTSTIAAELGIHQGSVARVLRRCAAAELCDRHDDGTWVLRTHDSTQGDQGAVEGSSSADSGTDSDSADGNGAVELGRRAAVLACDPSRLGAVAVNCGTVGARMRARALHCAEREEYARSAAYSAAVAQIRRAA